MRLLSRVWALALILLLVGGACQFITGANPTRTLDPNPLENDWALVINPDTLPPAERGTVYDEIITVGNVKTFVGEFVIEDGKLPEGLSLERIPSENATHITGIPQETGTFSFTLSVLCLGTNDPGQTGQQEYIIVVK